MTKLPPDSNHATTEAYEKVTISLVRKRNADKTKDPSPLKVSLGRGVYKDDKGKNYILPCVKMARFSKCLPTLHRQKKKCIGNNWHRATII